MTNAAGRLPGRLALLFVLLVPGLALAQQRTALVIGNGAYIAAPPLATPPTDARRIADMLRHDLGFDVLAPVLDGRLSDIDRALERFRHAAEGAEIALFFFAGYGMEVNGQNMLLPVGARLEDEGDVPRQTVPLERVLQAMRGARVKLVLLDACRDNPLAQRIVLASSGLSAVVNAGEGAVIAFAAAPGNTAADGNDADSPFTTALLQLLPTPADDIRVVLGNVSEAVRRATNDAQSPWTSFNLGRRVVLKAPTIVSSLPPAPVASPAPLAVPPQPVPLAPVASPAPLAVLPRPVPPAPVASPTPLAVPPRPVPLAPVASPTPLAVPPRPVRPVVPAQDCDRLAQLPRSFMGPLPSLTEGVEFERIDAGAALAACERAVRDYPEEPRFRVWQGRVLNRLGRDAEAVAAYRVVADSGYALAQAELGAMFQSGLGVAQNDAEAIRLYRLAASQGNAPAQYNLGLMYETGRGVERNYAEAVRFYRLAADQGNVMAQNNLGVMYETGRGVERNFSEAARFYRLAADQGNATAQGNLGAMCENGRGMAADQAEAVRLYRLAARQGNGNAQDNLRRLGEKW